MKAKMTLEEKIIAVYNANGVFNQIDQAIEEMAELTQALTKYKRSFLNERSLDPQDTFSEILENIYEEMADVQCMLYQLDIPFRDEYRDKLIEDKLDRVIERLNIPIGGHLNETD